MASDHRVLPEWLLDALVRPAQLPRELRMVSLLSGDLGRFCMAYKVPLTLRLRQAQAEVRAHLWNLMPGRTREAVDVPLLDEFADAVKHARRMGLSEQARTAAYAGAAKRAVRANAGDDEEDPELDAAEASSAAAFLATRTAHVLDRVEKVLDTLRVLAHPPTIRQCDTCGLGFAFVIGRKRPKDCEACRAALSPKQRWRLRQKSLRTRRRRIPRRRVTSPTRR